MEKKILHVVTVFTLTFLVATLAIAEDRRALSKALISDDLHQSTGLDIYGWASGGVTWNTSSNDGDFNGPISFNDEADAINLDQLYLVIEKTTSSDTWSIGGRVDLIYGRDASFTTSIGFDDKLTNNSNDYNLAIPQAYLEVNAPIGNGLSIKAGHFYTLIGYEVVTAPDNFFYSHAYSMQYAEPFTHWGGLATYNIDSNLSLTAGAVRGFDNMSDVDGNLSFLGSLAYNFTNDTSLVLALVSGNEGHNRNQTVYSLVLTTAITDSLSYILQHDFGATDEPSGRNAEWYSLNNYFIYSVSDELSLGARLEWFRDDDGARVAGLRNGAGGVPANYYAVTLGANYSLCDNVIFRPEVRYDIQDTLNSGSVKAFENGTDDEQLLVSGNIVYLF